MKYLTITCSNAYNYGAILQAYALQTYLIACGHEGKVINYKPKYLHKVKTKNPIKKIIRPIIRFIDFKKANMVFSKFKNEYISMTNTMKSDSDLKNKLEIADIYITGSDQVWNCSKGEVGEDDAFFLNFVKKTMNTKKISYAASIALNELPSTQEERFKSLLSDFDYISVREKTGVNIIKKLGFKNVTQVVDPVYLLSKNDWLKLVEKSKYAKKLKNTKYILVYGFLQQKDVYEYARKIANDNGYKLYNVNTWIEDFFLDTDKYFWNVTPEDFLALIYYAQAIVTNSFHGLSFSLIFNKEFYLFKKNGNTSSRMIDMVERVGLSNRIVENQKKIDERINYKKVNPILNKKIIESKEYLRNAFTITKE